MTRISLFCVLSLAACDGGGPPILGADSSTDAGMDGSVSTDGGTDTGPMLCDDPGSTERVACGRCGEQVRFCTAEGIWELGPCEDETGTCTPGETDDTPCGNCGVQRSECSDSCEWQDAAACMDEGECAVGERQRTPEGCETGQTRELLCSNACGFEESMACRDDGCDSPGMVETVTCGFCGSADRFCTSGNVWEYGPCEDEGVCEPGTSDLVACGDCGTQTSRCNTACEWVASAACTDEGVCSPGTTRTTDVGCASDETRTETCSVECTYEAGMCMPSVGVDVIFLLDMTGSHASEISDAATVLGDLAADVLALTNAQVGVAYYADFPQDPYGNEGDQPFVAGAALTTNSTRVRNAIRDAPTMFGNDQPESGIEALSILAGGDVHPQADPFVCPTGRDNGGCWRAAATPIVVLFTDAPQHNGPALAGSGLFSPYTTVSPAPIAWSAARSELMDAGIRLIAVTTNGGDAETQHARILNELGEDPSDMHIIRSGLVFSDVVDAILARITAIAG